ncbi:MAG: OmpA family protein [Pyrinomonadaceae bacterium]|nr:OmpA family protein [Sphingobacteriaceae bacterium]
MKLIHLKNYLSALLLLSTAGLFAQESTTTGSYSAPFTPASSFRTWSIGITAGALAPIAPFGKNDYTNWETDLGYGAYIKKQLSHTFSLQGNFLRGKLNADNENKLGSGANSISPLKSFETEIHAAGSLTANLTIGNFYWMNRKSMISPYLTGGAGLMSYKPVITTNAGVTAEFKPNDPIEEVFFPLGTGVKIALSKSLNLDLGYNINFVDSDNLDGHNNGPQNDKFSYAHAGLEFSLGSKSKPQLATYNPVAALEYDYLKRNKDLESLLASEREKNAAQLQQMATDWARFKNDEDKDGVSDYFDKCPGTPAGQQIDGAGCPLQVTINNPVRVVVTEEDRRVVAEAIKNLEFDFGKTTLRASSFPSLKRVAELLVSKNFSLKLAGHTDNVGSDAANLKLSKGRAESVKGYLVSQGANPTRIEATGYGESQPIEVNTTNAGRQKNRRVEFTLY